MDVVAVNDEVYFIIEKGEKYGIRVIDVDEESTNKTMWRVLAGGDEKRRRFSQIKYGQWINRPKVYSETIVEPEKLKKNVKYDVDIAVATGSWNYFVIIDKNKVITDSSSYKPKKRVVIIKKDGKKIAVPYTVEFIKNKEGEIEKKVITSHPERGRIIEDWD